MQVKGGQELGSHRYRCHDSRAVTHWRLCEILQENQPLRRCRRQRSQRKSWTALREALNGKRDRSPTTKNAIASTESPKTPRSTEDFSPVSSDIANSCTKPQPVLSREQQNSPLGAMFALLAQQSENGLLKLENQSKPLVHDDRVTGCVVEI